MDAEYWLQQSEVNISIGSTAALRSIAASLIEMNERLAKLDELLELVPELVAGLKESKKETKQ